MFGLVWFCFVWCGVFGYVSHVKFDFNAVKGGWVNSNLVYHRIGEIDPTMAET